MMQRLKKLADPQGILNKGVIINSDPEAHLHPLKEMTLFGADFAEGTAFVSVAEKWKGVWREALDIGKADRNQAFHVASVGSVSTYLLPEVFRLFMAENPECRLTFQIGRASCRERVYVLV